MISTSLLALLAFLTPLPILATPNVTPVPLTVMYPGTCTFWPRWINTRDADTTGTLMFTVSSADDTAVNDLMAQPFSVPWGSSTRNMLGIDLRKSLSAGAKSPYRCNGGQAVINNPFQNITISKDSNNAHMLVQPEVQGYRVEVYGHEIDGVRQDGVFLGALNRTTWGFRFVNGLANGACGRDYYEVKLLDLPVDPDTEPTAGSPPEFRGFIKVVDW